MPAPAHPSQNAEGPDHPEIHDLDHTHEDTLRYDLVRGLTAPQKYIPSKYLYDDEGSRLFDRITELDEYYPTRTESQVFDAHLSEMTHAVGPNAAVYEPGGGNGEKAIRLIDALDDPVAIIPIEISMDYVERSARALVERFPNIEIIPVCADFTRPLDPEPPAPKRTPACNLVFFPGSTVGNFQDDARADLLARFHDLAGPGGKVLVGVDLQKPADILHAAYDDSEGVTAQFNFNMLERFNREIDADFDPKAFDYLAEWDARTSAVEMYLVSKADQSVRMGDRRFDFAKGERIHTESSHKFTLEGFEQEAHAAGMNHIRSWTDERHWFAVVLLGVE